MPTEQNTIVSTPELSTRRASSSKNAKTSSKQSPKPRQRAPSDKPGSSSGNSKYWTDERKAVAMDIICEELSTTEVSLHKLCREFPEIPSISVVMVWLSEDATFQERYARAREKQADIHADSLLEIADTEEDPNRARVRIDARKWAAGKRAPQKYGDKLTIDGDMNMRLSDDQLESRLSQLVGKAGVAGALGGERTPEVEAEAVRPLSDRRPVKA